MDFYVDKLRKALEQATAGMTAEELDRRPGQKWSAAQILEHLSLTYSGTVRALEKCLAAGRPLVTSLSMKQRFAQVVVVKLGHMPEGRQAPERTIPRGMSGTEALDQIRVNLAAMEQAIARAEEKFGNTKIADHSILGPLSASEWRKFHWVHGLHHARQIERLKVKK